jgi:hypothetical protein
MTMRFMIMHMLKKNCLRLCKHFWIQAGAWGAWRGRRLQGYRCDIASVAIIGLYRLRIVGVHFKKSDVRVSHRSQILLVCCYFQLVDLYT